MDEVDNSRDALQEGWSQESSKDEKEKKKSEGSIKYSCGMVQGDVITEQIRKDDGDSVFLSYNQKTKALKESKKIQIGLITYLPAKSNLLDRGKILLPSGALEYGDGIALYNEIFEHINKYTDFPVFLQALASYYVMLSWVVDTAQVVPYLRFLGESGTGKSRCIDIIGKICYRPYSCSGSVTAEPIFRTYERFPRCTLVMDEADLKFSDETDAIIKILNEGFQVNGCVIRCIENGTGKYDPEAFPVFGCKIIATRRRFRDDATESRCLTITAVHSEKSNREFPVHLPRSIDKDMTKLRNKLLMYRFRTRDDNAEMDYSFLPDDMEKRFVQIISPLTLVVGKDEAFLNSLKDFAVDAVKQAKTTRSEKIEAVILEIILDRYDRDGEHFFLEQKQLREQYNNREGSRPLSNRAVGEIIRTALGLQTEQSSDPKSRRRIIVRDDERFEKLRDRYGYIRGQKTADAPPASD